MAATSQSLVNDVVLSSTLQRRSQGYENQISQQIPLFYWLKRKGQYKPVNGGTRIEWAVEYGLDDSEESYSGYDEFTLPEQDNVTIAYANWKQAYKSIVISGRDRMINTGQKIFDLLEQKEKNAIESLQQQMNERFYSDGTGNDSKRVTGLGAIIAEAPTSGTLFGINRANEAWWRNQLKDTNAAYWDKTNDVPTMRNDMVELWLKCGRLAAGGKKDRYPDLILGSENYYMYYDRTCSKIGQRFVNTNAADAGFTNLKFMGATLIHDYDCPPDAGNDEKAFFINSRFMQLKYHPQRNFKVTALQSPENQDAFVAKVLWMGELICTNCAKQGLHTGVKVLS